MSCSCCCCVSPSRGLLDGIRRKEWLVREEEAGGGGEGVVDGEGEQDRRNMDISLLREQYRCTRETQRRHTQVLLFRTVSRELLEAVSVIPVTPGLSSPWEPNGCSPPTVTFDPWHIPAVTVQLAASSSEVTNSSRSSRRSSSSSEAVSSRQDGDSISDLRRSSRSASPLRAGTACPGQLPDAASDSSDGSNIESCSASTFLSSSDESSTPIASIVCSLSSSTVTLHENLMADQAAGIKTSNGVLEKSSTLAWRDNRKSSTPAPRFTRQLSVGGLGSSAGFDRHPFPHRKTPRISEAARRLGMYSSF